MAAIFTGSIDLTKIDKSKVTAHANGSKYYQVQVVINDEEDKFGNTMAIRDNLSKEEREAGAKPVYLGNCKKVWSSEPAPAVTHTPAQTNETTDDDLPW
jgi:hypothetical protein